MATIDTYVYIHIIFVSIFEKTYRLKPELRQLGNEHLSDLSRRTKEAYESLCVKQAETLQNPSSQGSLEEREAFDNRQKLIDLEEGF